MMAQQRPSTPAPQSKGRSKETSSLEGDIRLLISNYHRMNSSLDSLKPYRCSITSERVAQIKKIVDEAVRLKKLFTVKGAFGAVRSALLDRGWLEKVDSKPQKSMSASGTPYNDDIIGSLPDKEENEPLEIHIQKCEKFIIARLLQFHEVDFYWNMRKDCNEWQHRLNRTQIINRFSRSFFTSKEGLCLLLQQSYWHNEAGVSYVQFPRCYTLNIGDQYSSFIDDFRLTACVSLIKQVLHLISTLGPTNWKDPAGEVPATVLKFAMSRCNQYIGIQNHLDIDKDFEPIGDREWEMFLSQCESILHCGQKIKSVPDSQQASLEASLREILRHMRKYCPQIDLDGRRNIWILKPGNRCRGKGIQLVKDLKSITDVLQAKPKYVIQKYIECPLVIYDTKFDIRQWFLITSVQPLMIWMYQESYLRFSSQNYNLDSFHESVHLTNNAVQSKYKNVTDRSPELPEENMWDCHTFKAYLKNIGHAKKWSEVIYPGMKECIVGAMLASLETMDRRMNTFELFGADFMLSEDFAPWLLEINSSPDMGPSTSVTARLCPQCLEDIVKVVVDRRDNPSADTGGFELVYKQNMPKTPAYMGMSLFVKGKKMFYKARPKSRMPLMEKQQYATTGYREVSEEVISPYNGPIIGDLIEEIQQKVTGSSSEAIGVEFARPIAPAQKKKLRVAESAVLPGRTLCPCRSNKPISPDRKSRKSTKSNAPKDKTSADVTIAAAAAAARSDRPGYKKSKCDLKVGSNKINFLAANRNKFSPQKENGEISSRSWKKATASILSSGGCSTGPKELRKAAVARSRLYSCNVLRSVGKLLPDISTSDTTASQTLCQNIFAYSIKMKNRKVSTKK